MQKEMTIDIMGITGLDPWYAHNHSSRKAMFATHVPQAPVVSGVEPRKTFTGLEAKYGDATFDISFPCDARVIAVIDKYTPGMSQNSIKHNPTTVVLYEDYWDPNKTVGVLEIPGHFSLHQDFGFRLEKNNHVYSMLRDKNALFSEGTVVAQTPARKVNGEYGIGINAEVAFISSPATIEDGFLVSRSFLSRMVPKAYNTEVGQWGNKFFPLNTYGDRDNYKPFPDIGDTVRDDGIVFALREYNPDLAVIEMTPKALRQVDYSYDRIVYGTPGAKVVDITVHHDDRLNPSPTPMGMDTQARKYYDLQCEYYRRLMKEYYRLKNDRKRGGNLNISYDLNRLLDEAQKFLPVPLDKRKLSRSYRLDPLDEWWVEVTCEFDMVPSDGYKFTDCHGGKGVVCKIAEDADMPHDKNNNRADVVIYGISTIKRMNLGRLFEQFTNATSRDLLHRLRQEAGLIRNITPTEHQLQLLKNDDALMTRQWDTLMRYYTILAPRQVEFLSTHPDYREHVLSVLREGIYLHLPPDNPVDYLEAMRTIRDGEFCPTYSNVTFRNPEGDMVTSDRAILIGSLYMLMLEKTSEDWSGAASVRTQHFGVPSKLGSHDRHSTPGRQQAVRALGESETRSYVSTIGPEATLEFLDQTNNPESHRVVIESILKARQPTNIDRVVDRNRVPLGGSRPVRFMKHLLHCRGVEFVYVSPDDKDVL